MISICVERPAWSLETFYSCCWCIHAAVYFLKCCKVHFGYMRLNLWSFLRIEKSSEPVLLQPVEDLLEDRSQYSKILNTETDILHCDTEIDILHCDTETDILCCD